MPRVKRLTREQKQALREEVQRKATSGELQISGAVREIRKSLGLTQVEFAARFQLTRMQVISLEKGTANPTLDTLQRLGAPFGFTVGFVMKDPNNKS